MIPKIMHTILLNDLQFSDKELLKLFPSAPVAMASFIEQNPDWNLVFWGNREYQKIKERLPYADLIDLLLKNKMYVKASDILRIVLLWVYGGLYSDLDVFWYKPIPEEWLNYIFIIGQGWRYRNLQTGKSSRIYTVDFFLGGLPINNPYLRECLVQIDLVGKTSLLAADVHTVKNAHFFDKIMGWEEDVYRVPPLALAPFGFSKPELYTGFSYTELGEKFPDSIGVHLYSQSWVGKEKISRREARFALAAS